MVLKKEHNTDWEHSFIQKTVLSTKYLCSLVTWFWYPEAHPPYNCLCSFQEFRMGSLHSFTCGPALILALWPQHISVSHIQHDCVSYLFLILCSFSSICFRMPFFYFSQVIVRSFQCLEYITRVCMCVCVFFVKH